MSARIVVNMGAFDSRFDFLLLDDLKKPVSADMRSRHLCSSPTTSRVFGNASHVGSLCEYVQVFASGWLLQGFLQFPGSQWAAQTEEVHNPATLRQFNILPAFISHPWLLRTARCVCVGLTKHTILGISRYLAPFQ